MKRTVVFLASVLTLISVYAEGPIDGLLDRIDSGLSRKMSVEIQPGAEDFFELSQRGDMPHITANNKVSAATGVHWYLKYYAGVMLTWDNMHVKLPQLTGWSVTRPMCRCVTTSIIALILIQCRSGAVSDGRRR